MKTTYENITLECELQNSKEIGTAGRLHGMLCRATESTFLFTEAAPKTQVRKDGECVMQGAHLSFYLREDGSINVYAKRVPPQFRLTYLHGMLRDLRKFIKTLTVECL